jgi:GNAT superfamily N-acetyltransferase
MTNCVLNRFEKDILTVYENTYGKVDTSNADSLSKASNVCNAVLIDICQSFYFSKKYNSFRLMDIKDPEGHTYSYVSSPFRNDSEGMSNDPDNKHIYYIRNGVFFNEIETKCNLLDSQFNTGVDDTIKEMSAHLKTLLVAERFYNNIFETNPIKKSLILKSREDFTISVFEQGMKVEDFSKIIKEQHINDDKDLDGYLNFSCGINFIKLQRQSDYSFFIVHNHEDIVGVGAIANNPFVKELPDSDKFKYLSFIAVSSAYRGHSVGVKISDAIMEHCANNNYIYESSGYTKDGAKYMAPKIAASSVKFEKTLPVLHEHYGDIVRDYIKVKFKEGCNYDEERQSLATKIIQLKAVEQEKGKLLKGDLKQIFGSSNVKKLKY